MLAHSFTTFLRQRSHLWTVVGVALAMAACATNNSKVRVDQDNSANLAQCRTFGWHRTLRETGSGATGYGLRATGYGLGEY